MQSAPNRIGLAQPSSDFFFVVSYSCLPYFFRRLEELLAENRNITVYCFSESIYKLLNASTEIPSLVHLVRINDEQSINIKYKRIWLLNKTRLTVNNIYKKISDEIPDDSRIYFYNRLYNLLIPLLVWKLASRTKVHYTECDPVKLYNRKANGFLIFIKWLLLSYIYPIPFQMMAHEGSNLVNAVPNLEEEYFTKSGIACEKKNQEVYQLSANLTFRDLSYESTCEVLWIMQPLQELNLVQSSHYEQVLKQCFQIVNLVFNKKNQAIKYHPRTVSWDADVHNDIEIIPNYFPVELMNLPRLSVIITISSTSVNILSQNPYISTISLVNIIPFINDQVKAQHEQAFLNFIDTSRYYLPGDFQEFRRILTMISEE